MRSPSASAGEAVRAHDTAAGAALELAQRSGRKRPPWVLPPSVLPLGLSRVKAAAYVGVSPTTFDRMVKDRLMPKAIRIYGRTVWATRKIEAAFAALDTTDDDDHPWGRMAL